MCRYMIIVYPCGRDIRHWCRCPNAPEDYPLQDMNDTWKDGAVLCNKVNIGPVVNAARTANCGFVACVGCPRPDNPGPQGGSQRISAAELQNAEFYHRFHERLNQLQMVAPAMALAVQNRQLTAAFTQTLGGLGLQQRLGQPDQQGDGIPNDLGQYVYTVSGRNHSLAGFTPKQGPEQQAVQPVQSNIGKPLQRGEQPGPPAGQPAQQDRRLPGNMPGPVVNTSPIRYTTERRAPHVYITAQHEVIYQPNIFRQGGPSISQPSGAPQPMSLPPGQGALRRIPPPLETRIEYRRTPPGAAPAPILHRNPPNPAGMAGITAAGPEGPQWDGEDEESEFDDDDVEMSEI